MTGSTYDVILHDSVGMPIDWANPLGGTEAGMVLLADALRAEGLTVRITHFDEPAVCRALILSRWSPRPPEVKHETRVVMAHDMWRPEYLRNSQLPIAFVSNYQREDFAAHMRLLPDVDPVIRPILGDHVRALKGTPKERGRFIYPTASNKGLTATLTAWQRERYLVANIERFGQLVVTSSGYDEPAPGQCEAAGARWLGKRSPEELALEIARSEGIYYVNTAPESFGMTVAIGRELGCVLRVWCEGHGYCGLRESREVLDLTPKTIARAWIAFLGLR